ncbi:MBL fold metallo-hydrolase [Zhengella sp. ZM62]|uniref:MBL fold metallo-hydrolase n=1 Tax=Zhengella sedimenti TaxID=3390035 RepID=UPI003976575B
MNSLNGFLKAMLAAGLAIVIGGCAQTAVDDGRRTSPWPFKDASIVATGIGSVLRINSGEGAPRTVAVDHAAGQPSVTWLGQSAFIIRLGGKVVMTDPMLSDTLNYKLPVKPARVSSLPPNLDRLPRLDAVVISHLDHDHFDLPSLRRLAVRFPAARLFVPEGTESQARRTGFTRIEAVPLWKTSRLGSLGFTALPANHYGRRDVVGLDRSLAIGWEISGAGRRIYFSGDTGYSGIFRQMRERRGRFDIALVPIGAWKPDRTFADIHMNPDDALLAASELGAGIAIGHHWGTFNFGRESPAEARERFLAAKAPGVRPVVLDVGGTLHLE